MLLQIRDSKVREAKIERGDDGELITIDVVPSVKERREACKLILAYTWGTPVVQGADEIEQRIMELEERLSELQPGKLQ